MSFGELLTKDLFYQVLLAPSERGSDELFAVTGYASAAMASRHFEAVSIEGGRELSINLHIGMSGHDGLSRGTLQGLQAIPRQIRGRAFNCTLSPRGQSIHSKVYVWCDETGPREAFLGSSDYTQLGFGVVGASGTHQEICTKIDPEIGLQYVLRSSQAGIGYKSADVFEYIDLLEHQTRKEIGDGEQPVNSLLGAESVDLPLVVTRGKDAGEVHGRSGLNWGQRENRNPNQAYIPVPASISKSGFFPDKGVHFQVITDDGEAFICALAQDGGKAIETPADNSILGLYFRRRLGLQSGARVGTEDLLNFGSDSVRFIKRDVESFELSFEPGRQAVLKTSD